MYAIRSYYVCEDDVEVVERIRVEVVIAHDAAEAVAAEEQLQLGRELFVLVGHRNVEIGGRQAVEVDRRPGLVLAIGDDGLRGPRITQLPFGDQRNARHLDVLVVNKADGELAAAAGRAAADYANAVRLLPPGHEGWQPPVLTCSARTGTGIAEA